MMLFARPTLHLSGGQEIGVHPVGLGFGVLRRTISQMVSSKVTPPLPLYLNGLRTKRKGADVMCKSAYSTSPYLSEQFAKHMSTLFPKKNAFHIKMQLYSRPVELGIEYVLLENGTPRKLVK